MRYSLFIFFVIMSSTLYGQNAEYRIHIFSDMDGHLVNASGVLVYTFLSKVDTDKARQKYDESYGTYDLSQRDGVISKGETGTDGIADVQGNPNGFLWIDATSVIGDEQGVQIVKISSLKPKLDDNGIQWLVSYTLEDSHKKTNSDELQKVTVMDEETVVEAKYLNLKEPEMKVRRHGRYADFIATIPIDSIYARDDARFVANTSLVIPSENNRLVQMLQPCVVQGEKYRKEMDRRMGFNAAEHDVFFPYIKQDQILQTRKADMLEVKYRMEIDNAHHLNAITKCWYEDFNSVYHNTMDIVWDGKFENPNRYLDWSGAIVDSELPQEHYERIGHADIHKGGAQYRIKFKIGSADIDLEDSLTAVEVNRLKEDVRRLYENHSEENYLAQDTIRGFASPEGGTILNEELSRKRASALSSLIRQEFPDYTRLPQTEIDAQTVCWQVVADTLEAIGDSTALDVARQLRQILTTIPSRRQEAEIVKNTWYKGYLADGVLPLLRRVEFSYASVSKRVRSKEEIIDLFHTNSNYSKGIINRDYEYFILMNYLHDQEDWEDLKIISAKAMQFSDLMGVATRIDTLDRVQGDSLRLSKPSLPFPRPYPLAAYYYAKSNLKLGIVDTTTLKPYYDFGGARRAYQTRNMQSSKANPEGWMNEEAILLIQTTMYAMADDYTTGCYLYDLYLSQYGDKYKKLGMFLRCLNGEYNRPEIREVVEYTTPMNYAIINICQGTMDGYRKALNALEGKDVPQDYLDAWGNNRLGKKDSRVPYLKAICKYNLMAPRPLRRQNTSYIPSMYLYQPGEEDFCWAAPMLDAFRLNPDEANILREDGYFNDAYRQLLLYFWNRLQAGDDMDRIKFSYDNLINKYYPPTTEK